jgi:ketosteroid isomerase-like protein
MRGTTACLRGIAARCALAIASAGALACGSGPSRPAAAVPSAVLDRGAASPAIARELDDFHDAAARADEARYFAHFSDDAVFLGTDATERWNLAAFRAFAHPHFAAGKAWSFHATRRAITVSEDGQIAYFDEDLATEKLGPARGSGVVVLRGGAWKIAQYNLAIVVPNERFAELRALLDRPAAPPVAPFEQRYKATYQRAVDAAARGDLATGEHALEGLLDEALAREGDDTAFWLRNELTWLRWGEKDLTGALGEVDGARSALLRARLRGEESARLGLHEKWDRAYLLLELAHDAPPTLRASALATANAARTDYEKAATPLGDSDGMAVLAAFFAVRAGDAKGALAAAKRVDAEKDADLQDIYVLALAYDLGGDHARADAMRKRVREGKEYLMKPLLLSRMNEERTAR